MIEEPSTSSMLDDRRRPGSDSDILDNRNGTNKQVWFYLNIWWVLIKMYKRS